MKYLLIILLALSFGCSSRPKYIEGTSTSIGLYIPMSGNIYGCEVLSYLNGCRVQADSNQTMKVERKYTATNSYFGVVHTIESTETKVEVSK